MSDMKDRVMQVILAEADVEKGFIPDHAKNKFSDNSGNLKCPFCDSEIEQLNDQQRSLFHCSNIVCCKGGHYIGNTSMWRDLIRTHKALGDTIKLAEEMLKDIDYEGMCSWYYEEKLNKIKSTNKGGDNE